MDIQFQRVFSQASWEKTVGYCRALKAGPHIYVTGTAPIDDNGEVFAPDDPYLQAKRCLFLIERALKQLNCGLSQVVLTRMFVTRIEYWPAFGQAHQEAFADHPPTTTMVEVKSLIDPAMLIEIEAQAYVGF